jgi:hypothetical protein
MKTIQILFVLALVLLSVDTVSAQYGNNGYGGGGNGYGNGRNNQMRQMPQGPSHDQPKEIPVEVTVGKIMENFKSQLNLDALQEIAISNVLTDSMRSQGILLKAETPRTKKQKKLQLFQKPWTEKSMSF